MRTKIRKLSLNEVSFVGKGDNPPAHVVLMKARTDKPSPIAKMDKEYKGTVRQEDALKKWLKENEALIQKDDAQTFDEFYSNREVKNKIWDMIWTLEDSIRSIMDDEDVTDKTAKIQQSVDQFKDAIPPITKGGTQMPEKKVEKTQEELQKQVGELEAQVETLTKEKGELEKACSEKDKKMKEMEGEMMKKNAPEEDIYKGMPKEAVEEIKKNKEEIRVLKEAEVKREYIAKAASTSNVGSIEEVGILLKDIAKHDPALADKTFDLLKAADARIAEGELLKEKGKGDGDGGTLTAYAKMEKLAEELKKEKPELSIQKAFTIVYDREHDLRKEHLAGN